VRRKPVCDSFSPQRHRERKGKRQLGRMESPYSLYHDGRANDGSSLFRTKPPPLVAGTRTRPRPAVAALWRATTGRQTPRRTRGRWGRNRAA
jgi:hypothetical protein